MNVFRSMRLLLLTALLSMVPASSFAGVFISINIAPPVMPVYEQPICPEDGYLWTPGYWAYGEFGYYWVPGAWVPAPQPGFLWTPPYWGWEGGHYLFHDGYWGEHVGYYGGVNYGFGYMGVGFVGGEWRGGRFAYNTAVMHVNTTIIHNTYVNTTIVHNTTIINNNHVAYSGGPGGVQHQPTPEEKQFTSERHVAPTSIQSQHIQSAAKDPQQRFSANHGKPATIAAARPMTAPAHAEAARPGQEARPATQPARPMQESRPTTQPARPAQETRPMTQPARPAQETRPAQEPRPATQPRPESHPAPAPRPESHPAPRPESHPAPKPQKEERPKGR